MRLLIMLELCHSFVCVSISITLRRIHKVHACRVIIAVRCVMELRLINVSIVLLMGIGYSNLQLRHVNVLMDTLMAVR